MEHQIVGYQSWRHLTFIHWRLPAETLQPLLPDGLTIETFDDSAWLGLVPFSMERVRPWWSPPVPGISWFLETNVRTYVRHQNGQTGVWFFSLDANHRLAVSVARRFWHLNYVHARLQLSRDDQTWHYSGQRPATPEDAYQITACPEKPEQLQTAAEGSLDHFLLERYHLFAQRPDGRFYCGQVHHDPYTWCGVLLPSLSQSLTAAAGCPIPDDHAPDHVAWSPGVDVRVSPLWLL
ncbi:MAG: DUF2071 domain-containing protein [Fuerstiella sp.]